ncbi:MAG: AMP-binding protein, partial [Dehalococcoidia bacterium]
MPKPEELGRDSASVEGQIYSEKGNTWPKVLKYNYETCGNKHLAIRHKYYGRWQGYTWADYYLNVKHLSLGLLALGFEVGDRTLIIGDNSPQRYYAELSVQVNHGISVGAYADSSPSEIQYLAENSELKFVVAQDQEQIDKLLEIKDKLPLLQKIIYWNYKGLAHYDDPILIGYEETLNLGREHEKKHPELFEQNVENGKDDDICAIVYTSGATEARPKGAIHTYKTAMANAKHYLNLDQWRSDDNVVPYLPPVGVPERWLGIGCHLLSANIMNLAEEPETLHPDTREIGPEVICYRARLWEARAALIQERMKGVDFLKRLAFRWLLPVGYKMADLKSTRQKPGLSLRILYGLANMVLFRPFRDSLGLSNARICYSTGSILSPDAFRLYHALNVPLKSVYCSAEGGALTGPRTDDIRFETVGPVHNSVEIQVSDEGEIICRQQGIFLGYYNDSEQTAKALKDGWFYSGDSGFFNEDEHLVFVDRIRDLVDIHGTDKLAPQFVESRLRFSPYIKDAWV